MTEPSFSNREINSMFERFDEKLDGHIINSKQAHQDIMSIVENGFEKVTDRQDIANGRTLKNELAISFAQGGLAVVTMIGVPILGWSLYELVHLDKKIQASVQEALTIYEVPNE